MFKSKFGMPNWLSLYRLLAAPVLLAFVFLDQRMIFSVLLAISLFTDMLDGFLARHVYTPTDRGARLDSAGDAMTFAVGLIGILKFETEFIISNLFPIALALGLYAAQLMIAFLKYGKPSSFHTYLAKAAALFQGVFMLWLLFFGVEMWLFYVTLILGIVETIEEIILIFLIPEWKTNVKGLPWMLNSKNHR